MYTAKSIPTLTGEAAERFEERIQTDTNRIDISEAFSILETIMQRSAK